MSRRERLAALHRARPRDRVLGFSAWFIGIVVAGIWFVRGFDHEGLFGPRRLDNLRRFSSELRPYPLQGRDFDLGVALDWAGDIWTGGADQAVWVTVAIAVLAIGLAAPAAALASALAARNLAAPDPFVDGPRRPGPARRAAWAIGVALVRLVLIVMRSVPEYVAAFFLVAVYGANAWPGVLALALHNTGILGRLGGETIENRRGRELEALRGLGATRSALAVHAILPTVLPRYLLYVFYRWETCVREATVLGMLGFLSLGFAIEEARIRGQVDVMVFLILLGAAIVMAGDLISVGLRAVVRRAR